MNATLVVVGKNYVLLLLLLQQLLLVGLDLESKGFEVSGGGVESFAAAFQRRDVVDRLRLELRRRHVGHDDLLAADGRRTQELVGGNWKGKYC